MICAVNMIDCPIRFRPRLASRGCRRLERRRPRRSRRSPRFRACPGWMRPSSDDVLDRRKSQRGRRLPIRSSCPPPATPPVTSASFGWIGLRSCLHQHAALLHPLLWKSTICPFSSTAATSSATRSSGALPCSPGAPLWTLWTLDAARLAHLSCYLASL